LSDGHVCQVVLKIREKKLERSTQRLIVYGVLGSLCNWAVDARHMNANPRQKLSKQRRKMLFLGEREDVKVVENPAALLGTVPEASRLLFKLALSTGLRIGELLGLRRCDIGETHVHVRGQLDRNTRQWTERTKTAKARRDVVLPAALRAEILVSLRAGIGDEELIFQTADGRGLLQSSVQRAFKDAASKAKLDKSLTFHAMRHTFASRLITSGYPVTVVQHQLGHKSPDITLKVYAHVFDKLGQEDKLRETLDSFFAELPKAVTLRAV
jgi:integrase